MGVNQHFFFSNLFAIWGLMYIIVGLIFAATEHTVQFWVALIAGFFLCCTGVIGIYSYHKRDLFTANLYAICVYTSLIVAFVLGICGVVTSAKRHNTTGIIWSSIQLAIVACCAAPVCYKSERNWVRELQEERQGFVYPPAAVLVSPGIPQAGYQTIESYQTSATTNPSYVQLS